MFAPRIGRMRAQELRGQLGVAVERFPLRGERDAVALAVEILAAILAADRRIGDAKRIGEPVGARRFGGATGRATRRRRRRVAVAGRSEEHTSELQSLLRISYAVLCW